MNPDPKVVYEFGPFRMDPDKQVLLRDGQLIAVTPKAFETLLVLVRRGREVVSKEELLKEVWPDSFVEEANLSQHIFRLRKALGDTLEGERYIVTLPGRGYRFAVPVRTITEGGDVLIAQMRSRAQVLIEEQVPEPVETQPAALPPPAHAIPKWRKWLLGSAIAAAIAIAGLGLLLLLRHHQTIPLNARDSVVVAPGTWEVLTLFNRSRALTETDTVVLADFANSTSDPVFDGTLRQGLAIELEQSPFLKIMDDEQVQAALRRMSLLPGARITNQIAHEVCVREGAAATIDGAIASLGKSYVITLQAIACQDGATLAREQMQAVDKEHVLNSLGNAATAMRGKLGESRSSIQKWNRPLEQATTPSLQALQTYTAGSDQMSQGHFLAAIPLAERAIALDPNFAMAYTLLAGAFQNAGDIGRQREYIDKAFALIDRVSPFERDFIATLYYNFNGELDKAIDADRLASQDYPRFWMFRNDSSESLIALGQFEEGLKAGQEAVRLEPRVEFSYRRLLDAYICLDRLVEAGEVAQKVRALGIGGARIHQRFLEMAYLQGDQAAVAREIQWYTGRPEEYLSFGLQAASRNVLGQRRASSALYERAAQTALRQGLPDVAAELEEADTRADALSGNCQTVHRLRRPALALAMCGDAAQAGKLAAETSKLSPNGTVWNAVELPAIRAAIELKRDQPARAVELLASASPYERAYPEVAYLRGLAYLRLKNGAEAVAEFRKIVDHKGANWGSTWQHPNWGQFYSLSYLGMARGYALAGDTAKAKKAFQDFLDLWKVADPRIPVLKQAKAEYAKLQ
jgi:DNA-binding winged helix-turn-helix (wHTH) protein/tetratricopeptide (TPR) repeat protein